MVRGAQATGRWGRGLGEQLVQLASPTLHSRFCLVCVAGAGSLVIGHVACRCRCGLTGVAGGLNVVLSLFLSTRPNRFAWLPNTVLAGLVHARRGSPRAWDALVARTCLSSTARQPFVPYARPARGH